MMEQVWLHAAPMSERIIEDLEHLLDVVKKISPTAVLWCLTRCSVAAAALSLKQTEKSADAQEKSARTRQD